MGRALSVLLVVLGFLYAFTVAYHVTTVNSLQDEVRSLTNRNTALSSEVSRLSVMHSRLQTDYNKLSEEHSALRAKYAELESRHNQLNAMYRALEQKYSVLESKYQQLGNITLLLNSTLALLHQRVMELCCIPYAFRRVLNMEEVKKVAPYVSAAQVRADDPFGSIQRIYDWVRERVTYANDTVTLFLHQSACLEFDGKTYCVYAPIELPQQVQTPEFTASTGRGDCDDQAVLVYAMIKYYFIFVHGKDYDLWLAAIRFTSGEGHLAVFLPVAEGKLTIIDPAGGYLTSDRFLIWRTITARSPLEELNNYEAHWKVRIASIALYRVDVRTGSYVELATGDKATIATYIQVSSR